MVFNSRSQENDPELQRKRDRERDERLAAKSLETAQAISEFFDVHTGLCCIVNKATAGTSPTITDVWITEVGLRINHRLHEITVACEEPGEMANKFRDWIRGQMSHITKVNVRAA